ncbi:GGDEF domain-containing protein [Candidatus Sulfurimonas marisnigri]|uniref:diguanylate cyclase n=1 Tax=Candidatus Sulfurimonas marisnigri TaxID=2740405 RepID=A0A7S7RP07_9BACT|nr:GGDEF domain-containing protein [Candidatus Sulfurimonas marisnigri]QOY53862.1 GGDEF domain-containing protein [Candidatus Sulfurimonas marisnigri]
MQKEELKSLAKEMYDNLIVSIDEQDSASVEQLVNYLGTATEAISNIDGSDITTLEYAKLTFHNAYKEIAAEGLKQYQSTNGKFLEISQEQSTILDQYLVKDIDLPDVTKKFYEIQKQMSDEIEKANEIIINLSNQVKTLETKSSIDSLTKVYNRSALSVYLETLCEEGNSNYEVHMLIMDLDDFKLVNDTYGHIAGDKILIFISNILKRTLRDGDKIFRYGGEEFIIILNRIDAKRCMSITNRILELVRANNLIYKGKTINVTGSIGTTMFKTGDTPDSLIERADRALYIAKNNGKNQVQTVLD